MGTLFPKTLAASRGFTFRIACESGRNSGREGGRVFKEVRDWKVVAYDLAQQTNR